MAGWQCHAAMSAGTSRHAGKKDDSILVFVDCGKIATPQMPGSRRVIAIFVLKIIQLTRQSVFRSILRLRYDTRGGGAVGPELARARLEAACE